MSHSLHYKIHHTDKSFWEALRQMSGFLPADATHIDALEKLPIFALVVVASQASLRQTNTDIDALLRTWADQNRWRLCLVREQSEFTRFAIKKHVGSPSEVRVLRYVCAPAQKELIAPEKKEAAAHILDEQITAYLRRKIDDRSPQTPVDCHILSIAQALRSHKLVCFDMDSTLIKQEVIDELAKAAGVGDKVNAITEAAMRGEIDFGQSFAERVRLLQGLDVAAIDAIKPMLIPQPGAFATIGAFKALGYRTALISGGFAPFAQYVAELLGIDEYHANALDIADGKLTGQTVYPILDGQQKAAIASRIAGEMGIGLDQVVCVGDGANDLPMFAIGDIGVAYRAKPIVQAKADAAVNITGLEGVLYALGYTPLQS